jgi:hypothetical protein
VHGEIVLTQRPQRDFGESEKQGLGYGLEKQNRANIGRFGFFAILVLKIKKDGAPNGETVLWG